MIRPNEHFRVICESLGLISSSPVAILTFYGDASGKRDKTNVAVAGYVARAVQWNRFDAEWSEMLRLNHIKMFHRSQMEPPFHDEFREKNWTIERQRPVIRKLEQIIKSTTLVGVAHAVKNRAFSQIVPRKIKRWLGGPYGWCVQACITYLGRWASSRGDYIHYIFEAGDEGEREITRAITAIYENPNDREKFRIAGWSFAPKKGPCGLIQLQAADFLAWESYKRIDRLLIQPTAKLEHRNLIRPNRDKLMCWTDAMLMAWI